LNNAVKTFGVLFSFLLLYCGSEWVPSVNDGFITGAEGAELYFRVMGTGKDTIVVVHGGPGAGMNSVLPSLKPLANKYVLIFYDQRGGGQSELPADTSKLQSHYFVEDLEVVRKHFALEKMNLLAHSFGSVLVADYAQKYSRHLKRIVFHGATGPRRSEAAKIYQKKAALSDTTLLKQSLELLKMLLTGTANDPVVTCQEYEAINRKLALARGEVTKSLGTTCQGSAKAVRYYYLYTAQLTPRSFGDWDFSSKLKHVSAPLLVAYGQNDTLSIPAQREWVSSVQNGRLLLVPNAWKGAMADNPDFVFTAIETFFNGRNSF